MLAELGLKNDQNEVATCCTSKDLFATIINKEGIKILSLMRQQMKDYKLFLVCDGISKKGIYYVIKLLS